MTYEIHGDGASTALFTFGSFNNPGRPTPSYAFMSTILRVRSERPGWFDAAYFLARRNDWYQGGVRSLGDDIDDSANALRTIAARYKRVICLGNSMGGYAAIVFAALIGAERAIDFSPQTRLDAPFREKIGDKRWRDAMVELQANHDTASGAARAICGRASGRPIIDIYIGGDCAQDVAYAEDMRAAPGVRVHIVAGSGHDLAGDMRGTGALDRVIADAVDGIGIAPSSADGQAPTKPALPA